MSRVKLPVGKQREFLETAQNKLNLKIDKLAEICGVHRRTFYDWWREKYKMSYTALLKLHKISKISLPSKFDILPEYWSTK